MKYRTARAAHQFLDDALKQLEIEVNDYLRSGWVPEGGICVIHLDSTVENRQFIVCQALSLP